MRPAATAPNPASTPYASLRAQGRSACSGGKSYLLENEEGQTLDTYSISAGLDYASVGPEHAWLKEIGRVNYGLRHPTTRP